MNGSHLQAASPVKIIIVPKAEEKPDLSSSILSNFAASQGKGTPDKMEAAKPEPTKPYSPYIAGVIKSFQEQTTEKKEASTPTHVIEEMVYVKEPVDADIELTVFKHREVNSLIRNRILALENSVVSKTIEKQPLEEVDMTIKEVVQVQQDEPILEQLKIHKEKEVTLPTSKIRELAQSMHKKTPVYEIPVLKRVETSSESESESESEEESEEESESESETESVDDALVLTQTILKEPETSKLLKPILTKQYSFDMEKKFHEEKDADGWKKVEEIQGVATSSSDSDDYEEPEVKNEIPPPPPPAPPKQNRQKYPESSDTESSISLSDQYRDARHHKQRGYPPGASPDEKRRLDDETVQRIIAYERSQDLEGGYVETFEDYMRRRNEKIGYDTDLNTSNSDYESEYTEGSEYSEFTNAVDNESFLEFDYRTRGGDYDSQSEYTEYTEGSEYTLQYGSETEYYTDSIVASDGYYDDRSDRTEYCTDEGDDRTLVDEEEFERERAHGKGPGYDQRDLDGAYTDDYYTDDYTDYTEH